MKDEDVKNTIEKLASCTIEDIATIEATQYTSKDIPEINLEKHEKETSYIANFERKGLIISCTFSSGEFVGYGESIMKSEDDKYYEHMAVAEYRARGNFFLNLADEIANVFNHYH